ncbi:MAG: glycosyltransferase family 2 protein [Deltaproteobacteria bacterium]|nr:glycosyltransferase family 2 protein [Deltaproteobacteria bacterium]
MISIILPTYNEVENIRVIVANLLRLLEKENIEGEIIVVDDDSPDGTAAIAMGFIEKYPVSVYVRKSDRGLSKAVIKGFELAKGDVCLVIDADLSHPVEKIPAMIRPILEDKCDMTVGSRYIEGGGWEDFSLVREIVSKMAGFLAKGITTLSDPTSGFMAIRKNIINEMKLDPLGWKIVLEVAVKGKPRIKEIPILFGERKKGRSKLGFKAQIDYIRHLWHLYCYSYPVVFQFIKFCIVGISGLFIDTAVLVALVEYVSFDPRFAAIFAFIAAVTYNYTFNRAWTFEQGKRIKIVSGYISFVLVCIVGLTIRIGVMHLLIKYAEMDKSPLYIIASLLGIISATIFNFLGSRYLVFSKLFFK